MWDRAGSESKFDTCPCPVQQERDLLGFPKAKLRLRSPLPSCINRPHYQKFRMEHSNFIQAKLTSISKMDGWTTLIEQLSISVFKLYTEPHMNGSSSQEQLDGWMGISHIYVLYICH